MQPRPAKKSLQPPLQDISIAQGWTLFMEDRGRAALSSVEVGNELPQVGTRPSATNTSPTARKRTSNTWSQVDRAAVLQYGSWLHKRHYAPPTLFLELNTIASVVKLLDREKSPSGHQPIFRGPSQNRRIGPLLLSA